MKEKNDQSLKEVIERLMKAYKWEGPLDEARLVKSWEKIVGSLIAKHTTRIRLKDKILSVNVDSAVIRNELFISRTVLIKRINQEMGGEVVEDIVLR